MISIYGIFKNGRCVYVGRTATPWRRESIHQWKFGRDAELRIFRQTRSDAAGSELEREYIHTFKTNPTRIANHPIIKRRANEPKRVSVKISEDAHRGLKLISRRSGRWMEHLLDEAIFEYLARLPEKVIREAPEPK